MISAPAHDPSREIKRMFDFRHPKYLLGDPTEDCPRTDLSECITLVEPPPEIKALHDQFSKLQTLLRGDLYIKRGGDNVLLDTQVGREFELKLWWFLKNECRLNVSPPDLTLFVAGSEFEPKPIIDSGKLIENLMEEEVRISLAKVLGEPIHEMIKIDVIRSPQSAWMGDLTVYFDDLSISVNCKTTTDDTIERTFGRPSLTVGRGARSKGADNHLLRFPNDEIIAFGIKKADGDMILCYFSNWHHAAQVPSIPKQDHLVGEKVCFYLDDLVAIDPDNFPASPEQVRSVVNSIHREALKARDQHLENEQERNRRLLESLEDASEDARKEILRELKFAHEDPALADLTK
jgi:hypothetical protein